MLLLLPLLLLLLLLLCSGCLAGGCRLSSACGQLASQA
jgi:hypothetical protein